LVGHDSTGTDVGEGRGTGKKKKRLSLDCRKSPSVHYGEKGGKELLKKRTRGKKTAPRTKAHGKKGGKRKEGKQKTESDEV